MTLGIEVRAKAFFEEGIEFRRAYYRAKPISSHCHKWLNKLRSFGLHPHEHQMFLLRQRSVCAICQCPETQKKRDGSVRELAIDHCHDTAKRYGCINLSVRGLLCFECNTLLTRKKANKEWLIRAVHYIQSFEELVELKLAAEKLTHEGRT
jgi:hypothetical protein